jgi:hypothetical protein
MRTLAIAFAISLAAFGLALPAAEATGCIYGSSMDCVVTVYAVYCFTEPCDGTIVCVNRGAVCSNDDLLP